MTNQVSDFFSKAVATIKSSAKVLLLARRPEIKSKDRNSNNPLIILANGPSLRETIDRYSNQLSESDTLAVNFAANAPEFKILKPNYYVLADPHFYKATNDVNILTLKDNLSNVDWPMTLFVDKRYKKQFATSIDLSANVKIVGFNAIGAEGFTIFERYLYKTALAMPRPRNVLIPSIMIGIKLGYKSIYLCGADHSWMRDIRVTEDNEVVSGMNHFYKENDKEASRARTEYKSYHLHDILMSYYVAFLSYHKIERFAKSVGVKIINATAGSYIDAFERGSLPF